MRSIELRDLFGEAPALGGFFRSATLLLLSIGAFVALYATVAWGDIPAAERQVLLNLYTSATGSGWTNSTNWNGLAGTECTWYGVTCDAGKNHVIFIDLPSNNLVGTMPDLSTLTNLQHLDVSANQLTGTLPSLNGLTNLQYFDVSVNQLTGTIPLLNGLINLQYFLVFNNELTGTVPSLNGLTNLQYFDLDNNQLTGTIPSLNGLTNLQYFDLDNNQLTGTIPSLKGLTNLQYFWVYSNQLTGTMPSLNGLTSLEYFWVSGNQLTGTMPSLSSLSNLQYFDVSDNQLSGDVPGVPSPNNLVNGGSLLCPNYLNHTSNPAWDPATGSTPWYQNCIAAPPPYRVNYNGNGSTGGGVPVDDSTYLSGQMVPVFGNTGALYKTGESFLGWNTTVDGSGTSYLGGNTFAMGSANVTLYAQWITASALPVRIAETLSGYSDIQSAYAAAQNGQTIEAQDALGNGNSLVFDNTAIVAFKLRGGYNATFTTDTGATLVIGRIEIGRSSIEIEKIIIQ